MTLERNSLSLSQVAIQIHFRVLFRLCRVLDSVALPDLCLEVIYKSSLCLDGSFKTTQLGQPLTIDPSLTSPVTLGLGSVDVLGFYVSTVFFKSGFPTYIGFRADNANIGQSSLLCQLDDMLDPFVCHAASDIGHDKYLVALKNVTFCDDSSRVVQVS